MSYIDWNSSDNVSEKLPVPCEYLVIPPNDYGVPNRKRHSSFKFQILTRGKNVQFTPILDGIAYTPAVYNTTIKKEVEYFFQVDTIAIDIGGILQSLQTTPFEFYGVVTPQTVEKLPDRLEYYRVNNTNYGIAAPKRVRTMPFIIDTHGFNVQARPFVDETPVPPQTVNTVGKRTAYYYFLNDSNIGTDFGMDFLSLNQQPFEFYEMGEPEIVEKLPVPKIYDQLGPVRFDKIGKIFGFRVRMIVPGFGFNDINFKYAVYGDSDVIYPAYGNMQFNGTIPTNRAMDQVYQVDFPKNVNTTMMRLALGPTDSPFYRYDVEMRVSESGMETDAKWIPIR